MGSARKRTQTGMGTLSFCPVGVRTPVAASILKTTSESEFWFAAMSQLPSGEMPKLRGVLPSVG